MFLVHVLKFALHGYVKKRWHNLVSNIGKNIKAIENVITYITFTSASIFFERASRLMSEISKLIPSIIN